MQAVRNRKRLALERAKSAEAENENLYHRISALEQERNRLSYLLKGASELPESIRTIVSHRLNMLNSLLASRVASVDILARPFDEWEKELKADKEKFMNENRIGYGILKPGFMRYLKEHDLTIEEINYICLYALGLNGSEIGVYLNMPGFKNKTKEIRRKLGLGVHDTNLKLFIPSWSGARVKVN